MLSPISLLMEVVIYALKPVQIRFPGWLNNDFSHFTQQDGV
jgi:hypothetical protein